MNIFASLRTYAGKWALKASRGFSTEEVNAVDKAVVVDSQYGSSVCFHMKSGGMTFIPLSSDSTKGIGEEIDLASAELLTLSKDGESDILRVKA